MKKNRVLLVDNNVGARAVFQEGLKSRGFEVVPASSVVEALKLISTETFDVLLTGLHMPDPSDGFTVVSAMRHTQPHAVTLVLSGYPALQDAMTAIVLQADQVLAKPVGLSEVAELIEKWLSNPSTSVAMKKERVAAILERETGPTISNWMSRVERDEELGALSLSCQERTGHLALLIGDLVRRLSCIPPATVPISSAARNQGILRCKQGYTVAMMAEEWHILQVSIFNTLQNNLGSTDFSTVLLDMVVIADELASQLKQALLGFMEPLAQKSASSCAA